LGLPKLVLLGFVLITLSHGAVLIFAQTPPGEEALQKARQQAVDQRRVRLEKAIEEDGFFSARVALNLWKREAQEAGLFDENTYDHYKHKLYNASIDQNLRCYELFLLQGGFGHAEACLKIWRLHAEEIDRFNPDDYEAMVIKLRQAKETAAKKKSPKSKK
jgi:hypothetical protein